MRKNILIYLAIGLVLVSCGGRGGKKNADNTGTRNFPTVSAPAMYTEQAAAANYIAKHFWDGFADNSQDWLTDSTHIAGVDKIKLEEQVGTFVSILSMVTVEDGRKAIEGFYDQVAKFGQGEIFDRTVKLVTRYLYDVNSPVRNEDIYGALAGKLARSPLVKDELKPSYEWEESSCRLNSVGTPAADFLFTESNGKTLSLYSVKAPYTLLFFSNPGCEACAEIIEMLKASNKITRLIENGTVVVVNVYIDEDMEARRAHLGDYPAKWHTGYDRSLVIRTDLLYNVRAIPSLYILDKDKKVIMKDAPQERAISYLASIEEE